MYYRSRRQMKTVEELQVYIQNNDFMRNKKLNLGKC